MICITFYIFSVLVEDDVIQPDDYILSHIKCVIDRSHLLSVCYACTYVSRSHSIVVMISQYRIDRKADLHDMFLIFTEILKTVPAYISQGYSNYRFCERIADCLEVAYRVSRKDCKMIVIPCLNVTDCQKMIVITLSCPYEIEVKSGIPWS